MEQAPGKTVCKAGAEKGRFRTLSSAYKSRKFVSLRGFRNEAFTLGVLYPDVRKPIVVPYIVNMIRDGVG